MNHTTPNTIHVAMNIMEDSSATTFPESVVSEVSVLSSSGRHDQSNRFFKNVPLTRRRDEFSLLKASYSRIQKGEHPSELVLIGGLSGTGKSMLATSIREPVTLKGTGYFVSGKFDTNANEPYSALVEAFSDLCDLVSLDTKTCRKITKALKGDISVLSKVIPNLYSVIVTSTSHHQIANETMVSQAATPSPTADQHHAQTSFAQLKMACRKFLGAVANEKHPVVLLIDDLQWADQASLQILEAIITDANSKYLLLIGTFRSEEEDTIEEFLETVTNNKFPGFKCTSIHLENFGASQVASLIANCTGMDRSEDVSDLADLVLKRTAGNPYFALRFMEMLSIYDLIQYDKDTKKWSWSVDRIQAETIATENVVEIVQSRIEKLPESVRSVLMLASLQGFTFDRQVVEAANLRQMTASNSEASTPILDGTAAQLDVALEVAENEGLIEGYRNGTFRFCHDIIADCLYSMTPRGHPLASAHLLLARVMQEIHDSNVEQDFTYSIAEQLNLAKMLIDTDDDRLECAIYNLRAANLALTQSAFSLASDFARSGLTFLDLPTKWESKYYSTVFDLHCVAAEALHCSGNLEESNENLEQVFQHARSMAATTRARRIHMYSLGAQARYEEAIDVAFNACRDLGVKIPRHPNMRNAIWQLVKTKLMLRGRSDEELLAAARMGHGRLEDVAFFLFGAVHYASMCIKVPHLILGVSISMQLTLKGECFTAGSFSNFGILESTGNIPGCVRMARLTANMYESQSDQLIPPGDLCSIHTFMAHWRAPFRDSMEPLKQAYCESLETGLFDVAFMAASAWMQMAMFCGYPLCEVEHEMRALCGQMHEFDYESEALLIAPYWQLCLNLIGESDDPVVLSGDAMDEITYTEDPLAAKVTLAPQVLNVMRVMVACHFECSQLLQALIAEREAYEKVPIGHFLVYATKFYDGLSYIKLYRVFARRSSKRKAIKIGKELRKWTLDGCPNTKPLHMIIDAELATLTPRHDPERVGMLFVNAIQESCEVQNDFLEAMANERAACYHQAKSTLNRNRAQGYMERAVELYSRYGAFAKVEFLERTCSLLGNTSYE